MDTKLMSSSDMAVMTTTFKHENYDEVMNKGSIVDVIVCFN